MGGLTSLDRCLDALLHKRSVRSRVLRTGLGSLGLSPDDREALSGLDLAALTSTAETLCAGLFHRAHRGVGTLAGLFPTFLGEWLSKHPEDHGFADLAADFMDSPSFDEYREHSHTGLGRCLEECFMKFCEARTLGDPVLREREGLSALVRAVATSTPPGFLIPEALRPAPRGFFAVTVHDPPFLYATLDGKFVQGPLTPLLRDLLNKLENIEVLGARYGGEIVRANLSALRDLGLIA